MKLRTFTLLIITFNFIFFQANAQTLGGIDFNGINNYIDVKISPLNEIGNGDFTFEAWIKGESSAQNPHPMIFSNRGNNSPGGGILFFLHDQWGGSQSKLLSIQINGFNYKFVDNGFYNGSLLDNECHHVAITRNGNTLSFYGDGILIGTTSTASLGSVSSNGPLWIGKDPATNNTFNGIISQCRIWNVARTQSEINAAKDLSLQGNETGLLAYWEMNDVNGQIVYDKTNHFNGILGSSVLIDNQDPSWSEDGCIEALPSSTDNSPELFFNISPNPTFGLIKIEHQSIEDIKVSVIDQSGRLLLSEIVSAPAGHIDISSYPQGIYLLSTLYKNQVVNKKIIKI